jgi:transcriptional regulator with XRE-family HTH domain
MILLRRLLGDALRRARMQQHRTLRDVSASARVSLGYLSEVERGQKEASSELLAAICAALGIRLADLLRDVSDELTRAEPAELTVGLPALPNTLPPDLPPLTPAGGDAPAAELRAYAA